MQVINFFIVVLNKSKKLPFGTGLPVVINIGKPLSNTVANSDAHVSPLQLEKAPTIKYNLVQYTTDKLINNTHIPH